MQREKDLGQKVTLVTRQMCDMLTTILITLHTSDSEGISILHLYIQDFKENQDYSRSANQMSIINAFQNKRPDLVTT